MIITTYMHASDFLARARAELERNEVLNGLLLGIALRLQQFPECIEIPPIWQRSKRRGNCSWLQS